MVDMRDWSNSLSTTTTPEEYMYGMGVTSHGNQGGLYQGGGNPVIKKATSTQNYNGAGGSFTRATNPNAGGIDPMTGRRIEADTGLGGTWTSAQGRIIGDLPGYLKKGSLQQTGSDFSNEQNMLSGLLSDPSKIQQTAGYQFDVDQGNQAINRSAAARGSLNSGGVLAELAKYGQGMASREYGNQVNRLSSLIGQKQQFGLGSGYYDDLKTPQVSSGGGSSSRVSSSPAPTASLYGNYDYNLSDDPWFKEQDAIKAAADAERTANLNSWLSGR